MRRFLLLLITNWARLIGRNVYTAFCALTQQKSRENNFNPHESYRSDLYFWGQISFRLLLHIVRKANKDSFLLISRISRNENWGQALDEKFVSFSE